MAAGRSGTTARLRTDAAVRAGGLAAVVSRRLRLGSGAAIGGRVTQALDPGALARLAAGRRVVLVTGTNGKTTTAHMLAAALRTAGPVAHNAGGANMTEGVVSALMCDRHAPVAVLEVDELHVGAVARAVAPEVLVLLNLTRDQLDRGSEVRLVAEQLAAALRRCPDILVVANADDPVVVGTAAHAERFLWVAAGSHWLADAGTCPRCGRRLEVGSLTWRCACGLHRPVPGWAVTEDGVASPGGRIPVPMVLPGRFNLGNAALAMAAASALGVDAGTAASAIAGLRSVAGRYAAFRRGTHTVRLLLGKNPASWVEALTLLPDGRPLVLAANARAADGRDTSWLWDVPFEQLPEGPLMAAGERAADVGLRLAYAGREHGTERDPLRALDRLPPGDVHVVANYTAFRDIHSRLAARRDE